MTGRAAHTATLLWEGRTIAVTCKRDWLDHQGYSSVELRVLFPAAAPLPVTPTGYKHVTVLTAQIDAAGGPSGYARTWLDRAASGTAWRAYVEASRQLSLF